MPIGRRAILRNAAGRTRAQGGEDSTPDETTAESLATTARPCLTRKKKRLRPTITPDGDHVSGESRGALVGPLVLETVRGADAASASRAAPDASRSAAARPMKRPSAVGRK